MTTAMELFQDFAEYVQDQARPPTTVMIIALASVVVSPAVAALDSQETVASAVYQEGCSCSHGDRDHHGGISQSCRGVHRGGPSCVSRRASTAHVCSGEVRVKVSCSVLSH